MESVSVAPLIALFGTITTGFVIVLTIIGRSLADLRETVQRAEKDMLKYAEQLARLREISERTTADLDRRMLAQEKEIPERLTNAVLKTEKSMTEHDQRLRVLERQSGHGPRSVRT